MERRSSSSGSFPALPSGRHHLSRQQVRASQRHRMLVGMAEAVAAKGYANTVVADVLTRVHVSRETFYQHFADKQDCFLAALEQCAETLLHTVVAAGGVGGLTPVQRFERSLQVYLDVLTEQWALARTFFIEAFAAGPQAQRLRFEVRERFVTAMAANFAEDPGFARAPDPEFACRALAAALDSLVAGALVTGDRTRVAALHTPIMALVHRLL